MDTAITSLQRHTEAIIFCATTPIQSVEIANVLSELYDKLIQPTEIEAIIALIRAKYASDDFPFQVMYMGGGYQFLTKPFYQDTVNLLLKQKSKKRLSSAAMETLAIIAYKQPITKAQIELLRGVNVEYAIQKLLEKELIELRGKADTVGKPLLYGTTPKFLDYFGINSLTELPTPKDIINDSSNTIGEES